MATRLSQAATPPYQPLGHGARLTPSRAVSNNAATAPGTQQHALKGIDGTSRSPSMPVDVPRSAPLLRSHSAASSSLMAPSLHENDADTADTDDADAAAGGFDDVASPRALRLELPATANDPASAAAAAAHRDAAAREIAAQEAAARDHKQATADALWNITLCEAREASAVLALALHRGKGRREAERRAVASKRRSADAQRHLPAELAVANRPALVASLGRVPRSSPQRSAAAPAALESLREAGTGLQGSPFAIRQILTPVALPEDTAVPHRSPPPSSTQQGVVPTAAAAVYPASAAPAASPMSASHPAAAADVSVASSRPASAVRASGPMMTAASPEPYQHHVVADEGPSRQLRYAAAAPSPSPPAHTVSQHQPLGQPGHPGLIGHSPAMVSPTAGAASPSPHQPQPLPERKRHAGPRVGEARPAATLAHAQTTTASTTQPPPQQRRSLPATSVADALPMSPTPAAVQPLQADAPSDEASEPIQALRRRGHGASLPIAPGVMDRSTSQPQQQRVSPSSASRSRQGSRAGAQPAAASPATRQEPRAGGTPSQHRAAVAPQSEDEFFSFTSI